MASYGYRVSLFQITEQRQSVPLDLTSPRFPGSSAYKFFLAGLQNAVGVGVKDDRKSTFFTVDTIHEDNWGLGIIASGGGFGTPATVVDTISGLSRPSKDIDPDEAVMRDSRILMIVPPGGNVAVTVFEVQSNSSLQAPIFKTLETILSIEGLTLRVDNELADKIAWSQYLGREDVGIKGVELTERGNSIDRSFDDSSGIRNLKLGIGIEPDGRKSHAILDAIRRLGSGDRINLAPLLGIRNFDDVDFEDQKLVTVQDGQTRTIDVTSGWPRFVYRIDEHVRPSDHTFIDSCMDVVKEILEQEGTLAFGDWWPTEIRPHAAEYKL